MNSRQGAAGISDFLRDLSRLSLIRIDNLLCELRR